jgi:hypothetical protein
MPNRQASAPRLFWADLLKAVVQRNQQVGEQTQRGTEQGHHERGDV